MNFSSLKQNIYNICLNSIIKKEAVKSIYKSFSQFYSKLNALNCSMDFNNNNKTDKEINSHLNNNQELHRNYKRLDYRNNTRFFNLDVNKRAGLFKLMKINFSSKVKDNNHHQHSHQSNNQDNDKDIQNDNRIKADAEIIENNKKDKEKIIVSEQKESLSNNSSDNDVDKFELTHASGETRMVNINTKQPTFRYARASCFVITNPALIKFISKEHSKKGDVLRTAEIAGILAAKKTSDLIPLCHLVEINTCLVKVSLLEDRFKVDTYVESFAKTGVEMEAILSCSVAAVTIYDMLKSADKSMVITDIKLDEKFGGKSGHYLRQNKLN